MSIIRRQSVGRAGTALALLLLLTSCATVRNWRQSPIEQQVAILLNDLEEEQGSSDTQNRVQQEFLKIGSPAVSALATALQDKRPETRIWAARALPYVGSEASGVAVPALIAALDDEHQGVRYWAEWSLCRISDEPDLTIPALLKILKQGPRTGDASSALSRLAEHAHIAIPGLMESLQSESPAERRFAVRGLAAIGRQPETVVPGLMNALHDSDNNVRAAAAGSFYFFASKAQAAVPALIRLLRDEDRQVRQAAMVTLGNLSKNLGRTDVSHKARTDIIVALVQTMNEDKELRAGAARTLARIGTEAAPYLIRALDAENPEVRSSAAMAFRYMERLPDRVVPHLIEALSDEEITVAWQAAITLVRKERHHKTNRAIPLLNSALRSPTLADKRLRQSAVDALGDAGSEGVPGLIYALFDPAQDVRYAAVIELSLAGKNDANVVPAVIALALNPEEARYVRRRALSTLKNLFRNSSQDAPVRERTEYAIATLSSFLQSDPELRVAAADTLVAMHNFFAMHSSVEQNGKYLDSVVLAFVHSIGSDNDSVRRLAAPRLAAMRLNPDLPSERLEEAFSILKAAMDDRDKNVRWAAALTLASVPGEFDSVEPVLWRALSDNGHVDPRVQSSVAETLTTLGPDPKRVAKLALSSRWADVRSIGVSAFARTLTGQEAVAFLEHALNDSAAVVRSTALSSLKKCVTDPEVLVPLYLKALSDADDGVQRSAEWALQDIGTPAVPVLITILEDGDELFRVASLKALARCVSTHYSLVPIYKNALKDPSEEVRRIAAEALVEQSIVPSGERNLELSERGALYAYGQFLEELDKSDLNSLREMVERFQTQILPLSSNARNAAIIRTRAFCHDFVKVRLDEQRGTSLQWKVDSENSVIRFLCDNGLVMDVPERGTYNGFRGDLLSKPGVRFGLESITLFLRYLCHESGEFREGEAIGLATELMRTAQRSRLWLSYLRQTPYSCVVREEASERLRYHTRALLRGSARHSLFKNEVLLPEAREAYQHWLRAGSASISFNKNLAVYYAMLERNEFRWTEEIGIFLDAFEQYNAFLTELDPRLPSSIPAAIAYCEKHFADLSVDVNDAVFFQFRDYFEGMLRAESLLFSRRESDFERYAKTLSRDERRKAYVQHNREMQRKALSPDPVQQANGIHVRGDGEGGWHLVSRPDFLVSNFGDRTSAAVRDYLNLERSGLERPSMVDGHIALPFAEISRRAWNWEQYLDEHPDSPYRDDANKSHKRYINIMLGGPNGAWVFDRVEGGKLELLPGVREVYEQYIREHGSTGSGKKVAEFYAVLERHDFSWTEELTGNCIGPADSDQQHESL